MKNKKLFSPIFIMAVVVVLSGLGFFAWSGDNGRALSLESVLFWRKSPRLFIYNLTDPSRNPVFLSTDEFRLAATGKPNKTVETCYIFTREKDGYHTRKCYIDPSNPTTNSSGTWHWDSKWLTAPEGGNKFTYRWWVNIDGKESNKVTQIVKVSK